MPRVSVLRFRKGMLSMLLSGEVILQERGIMPRVSLLRYRKGMLSMTLSGQGLFPKRELCHVSQC